MRTKTKALLVALPIVAFVAVAAWYLHHTNIPVLEPAGEIGRHERQLMIVGLLLAIIVVVPVYVMTILIAWKYRESNKANTKYQPDWDHSRVYESLWWGIPMVIITILSVIAWRSSHTLDPFRPISSTVQPLTIQVVAMDWKWLFIYPEQHIASVNLAEFPEGTPLNFQITSDTVMNSFWIPQLGGQIYAMPGMSTQLHLIADRPGNFYGTPANIAGRGFADMTFTARSVPKADFDFWVAEAQQAPVPLDSQTYSQLARPSENNPTAYYASVQPDMFVGIVEKYMVPGGDVTGSMSGMSMPGVSK